MSKGGTVKRKGGGMAGMKKTKYMSKGGALKRKMGGKTKYNIKYTIKPRYIMHCIN